MNGLDVNSDLIKNKDNNQSKAYASLPSAYDQSEVVRINQMSRLINASNNNGSGSGANPNNKMESNVAQILPRLWLGDDIIARNLTQLRDRKITHVLNLTTNIPNKFEPELTYLKLTIFDFESQNISQYFDEASEFISEALKNEKNSVLVHCNAGISRSASFVIAYLLKNGNFKTYKEALAYLRKYRPIVSPNRGFEKQLLNLERHNKRKFNCNVM